MDIIKTFENNNAGMHITIKGTHEEPLFRASDIGAILDIVKIRNTISDFDNTEKVAHTVDTLGGPQEVLFLTEKGLYQVLFTSRKPIAKKFKNWVCEVIKEIRLNGRYQLEKQINDIVIQKEQNLLDNFRKKPLNYVGYTEDGIIKFGYTDDFDTRLTAHKREIKSDWTPVYVYESVYNREIERQIKKKCKKYIIEKTYNDKKQTELIQLSNKFTIDDLDKIIKQIKQEVESEEQDKDKNSEIDSLKLELLQLKEKYESEINKFKNEIIEFKKNCNIKMVNYSCSVCGYTTGDKGHIERHINQTKCSEKNPDILHL
jgi:prophage antirepressor-like protein/predicted GIY-YIG superfamily endonuclease